jgi:hypothetical protein
MCTFFTYHMKLANLGRELLWVKLQNLLWCVTKSLSVLTRTLYVYRVYQMRQDIRSLVWAMVSRDSVVSIATIYGLDDRRVGVRVLAGSRIFSSQNRPGRLWGPPNLLFNGYGGALSSGVKRPGREIDHSPPTSAEVKKMWISTSTPHTPSWRSA